MEMHSGQDAGRLSVVGIASEVDAMGQGAAALTAPVQSEDKIGVDAEKEVNGQRRESNGVLPQPIHGTNTVNGNAKEDTDVSLDPSARGNLTKNISDEDSNSISTLAPIPPANVDGNDSPAAEILLNESISEYWSPATKLKHILQDTKKLIVCPGVYDGFSARIALSVGFEAMYMVCKPPARHRLRC